MYIYFTIGVTNINYKKMKKVLWIIVCLMTMVFVSCGDKIEEPTNFEINITPIFEKYDNWTSNDLVYKSFEEEILSFFEKSSCKTFSNFYNGKVKFDEIVESPYGYEKTDSVVVRFKCREYILTKNDIGGHNSFFVHFDVIGKLNKSDAMALNDITEYYIDGQTICFFPQVFTNRTIGEIEIGTIVCGDIKIK